MLLLLQVLLATNALLINAPNMTVEAAGDTTLTVTISGEFVGILQSECDLSADVAEKWIPIGGNYRRTLTGPINTNTWVFGAPGYIEFHAETCAKFRIRSLAWTNGIAKVVIKSVNKD